MVVLGPTSYKWLLRTDIFNLPYKVMISMTELWLCWVRPHISGYSGLAYLILYYNTYLIYK